MNPLGISINSFLTKLNPKKIIIFFLFLTAFVIIFWQNISMTTGQNFIYLADSFLKGRLDFQPEHEKLLESKMKKDFILLDAVNFEGKIFWPLGPFPAIILMPFVAIFGTDFLQGYLSFLLVVLSFILLFKMALKMSFKENDSIWLASSFIFGSCFLFLASVPGYSYFANVVAFTCILLSIFEWLNRKRYLIIGACLSFAIATQLSLLSIIPFFLLSVIIDKKSVKQKITDLLKICIPVFLVGCLLLFYNWLRFGNVFETGYNLQINPPVLTEARSIGLFNIKHAPGNLFFLLFSGPSPVQTNPKYYLLQYPFITFNPWGMSIFSTSPILLYLILIPWRDKLVKLAALGFFCGLIPVLLYYGIGIYQIGYRYIIPLYPFLFLMLARTLSPKLDTRAKMLILLGIILNWHFLFCHFINAAPAVFKTIYNIEDMLTF